MHASLRKNIIEGFGFIFGINQLLFLVQFVNGVLLARLLLPEDFGKVAYFASIITMIFIFRGFGFDNYIIQCDKTKLEENGGTAVSINTILSLFICFIAVTIASFTMDSESCLMFILLLLSQTARHLYFSYANIITKELLYKKIGTLKLIPDLLSIITATCCAISGYGIWSLIWMEVIRALSAIILSRIYAPYYIKPGFSFPAVKDIWNYGKFNIINAITVKSSSHLDNIVIQKMSGSHALGFYNKGYGFSKIFNHILGGVIIQVSSPLFSRYKADKSTASKLYNKVSAILFRTNLGFYLILGCIASDLIELVYTSKWLPAVPVIRTLIVFGILKPLITFTDKVFLNTGNSKPVGLSHSILFLIMISTIIPLVKYFGVIGAAISIDLSFAVCFGCLMYYINKIFYVDFKGIFFAPLLISGIVLIFYLILTSSVSIPGIFLRLLIHSVFTACCYFGCLFIYEKNQLFGIINKIRLSYA